MYDGYHFTKNCPDLYNPFSLLLALQDRDLGSYWFETARPSFIVEQLKDRAELLSSLLNSTASDKTLSDVETFRTTLESLMFQTGYLTIKGYDPEYRRYILGIPNREVEEGLFEHIAAATTGEGVSAIDNKAYEIRRCLRNGEADDALENP